MNPARTPRSRRTWSSDSHAVSPFKAAAAATTVAAGIAAAAYLHASGARPATDANLCPVGGVGHHLAVLVDQSDPLTREQASTVVATLEHAVDAMQLGDRITVFRLSTGPERFAERLVDLCRPKRKDEADPARENPREIANIHRDSFVEPIGRAWASLRAKTVPETSSPIVEAVHAVATGREFKQPARTRSLHVYSDLMQLSRLGDAYSGPITMRSLEGSIYLAPKLHGVEVVVYRLPSSKPAAQPRAVAFFEDFFKRLGGGAQPKLLSM
jgi:hypothetical protein